MERIELVPPADKEEKGKGKKKNKKRREEEEEKVPEGEESNQFYSRIRPDPEIKKRRRDKN